MSDLVLSDNRSQTATWPAIYGGSAAEVTPMKFIRAIRPGALFLLFGTSALLYTQQAYAQHEQEKQGKPEQQRAQQPKQQAQPQQQRAQQPKQQAQPQQQRAQQPKQQAQPQQRQQQQQR